MGAFCDGLEFSSTLSSKYCSLILLSLQRGDFVLSNYGEEEKLSSESFFTLIKFPGKQHIIASFLFLYAQLVAVGGQG